MTDRKRVILPTVGDPQLVLPVQRLLEYTLLDRWALTVVCNPWSNA